MEGLLILLGLIVLATPLLALVAFLRSGRQRSQIAALQRDMAALRAELARLGGAPAAMAEGAEAGAAAATAIPAAPRAAGSVPSVPPAGTPEQFAAPPGAGEAPPPAATPAQAAEPAPPAAEEPSPAGPPPLPEPAIAATAPPAGAATSPPPVVRDLEQTLTLRWAIWAGAAALLLAGVFLIRYAVENELLGPGPRCVLAALLGAALIGAGEWLRRHPPAAPIPVIGPDQAPAALVAGGVAVLFGAAYAAGPLYGLVPPALAFLLLAAAGLLGMALSLLHGRIVAAVGIAGAFLTPALVQTEEPSFPGLFAYLLVVTAAAIAVVRHTAWAWLGWAAICAGALWAMLGGLEARGPDRWAPALFVPAAAAVHLALLPRAALAVPLGRGLAWAAFAALALAGLVNVAADPGFAGMAGVLLLSAVALWEGAARTGWTGCPGSPPGPGCWRCCSGRCRTGSRPARPSPSPASCRA